MATEEIYMNVPEVTQIGNTFGQISDVLKNVSQVLNVMIDTLRAAAFVGFVAGAAEAQFLNVIKQYIDGIQKRCDELKKDVLASVKAYENGDQRGSQIDSSREPAIFRRSRIAPLASSAATWSSVPSHGISGSLHSIQAIFVPSALTRGEK